MSVSATDSLKSSASESWCEVANLLDGKTPGSALARIFPPIVPGQKMEALPEQLSVVEALGSHAFENEKKLHSEGIKLQDNLQGILKQLQLSDRVGRCPILAVSGMLNAGKSSLISTYLSMQGRQRVAEGVDNASGTHRFVIWLPSKWKDDSQLHQVQLNFISQVFGYPPELLAEDPQDAVAQCNGQVLYGDHKNVDPIDIPLVAYDSELDSLQIGLLDCPDVQSGFGFTSEYDDQAFERRLDRLRQVGRVCSAFIIVSKLGQLGDATVLNILSAVRDTMPGVPRLLAVNQVKTRYEPQVVAEQARPLVDRFGLGGVFVAYDFRSLNSATRIPPRPPGMKLHAEKEKELPIFFEVPLQLSEIKPSSETPKHYLFDLGQRLDVGSLPKASRRSLELQLKVATERTLGWIGQVDRLQIDKAKRARTVLAEACYQFMAERDEGGRASGLRLHTSPAIVSQIVDSLERTSPAWLKPSLWLDRNVRRVHSAVSNATQRWQVLANASSAVKGMIKSFRSGENAQVMTADRLVDEIQRADFKGVFEDEDKGTFTQKCEQAISRFSEEDHSQLDEQSLDEWSREVWKAMPARKKAWRGAQPLAVMTAPLLAAILLPFDGGGSAVIVFASTKELLAAAGIAAAITPVFAGQGTSGIAQQAIPLRQLSDLFATVCDGVGVPRADTSQMPKIDIHGEQTTLQASETKPKPEAKSPTIVLWNCGSQKLAGLKAAASNLSKA